MGKKKYLHHLKNLVNIKSYTSDRAAVNRVNAYLSNQLKTFGFKIKNYKSTKAGDLLVAQFPTRKTRKNILLSGHTDIVPFESFHTFKYLGEQCSGSGIADMKAGLATILGVVEQLAASKNLEGISCIFTPDEETGSQHHKTVQHTYYKNTAYAFVFEPGLELKAGMWHQQRWIVTKRKGVSIFQVVLLGNGGHAGNKLTDRNSTIEEMSRKVLAWHSLTDVKKGVTVNVGTVRGGETANVISPVCEATIDLRTATNRQYEEAKGRILQIAQKNTLNIVTKHCVESFSVPPMEKNSNTKTTLEAVDYALSTMKIKRTSPLRGGGSDGNQMNQYGVGVLDGLGPIGGDLHTQNEWIYTDSLMQSVEIAVRTIRHLQ